MMQSFEKPYKTTCSYCGVGCGIIVRKSRRAGLTVEGDPDHPVNRGMLCSKGMNLHYAMQDTSDRLLYPEMRWGRNQPMVRVSWNDAMARAAAVFKSIIQRHGPDAVGFYVSGQCLTEEYYVLNKLVKGFLGTNNIDTNSRLCMSSAVSAYTRVLGEDAVPVAYDDIERSDCLFITGANPAWCHPILFRRIEAHKQKNPDVKIIVADPRRTQTSVSADLHLQLYPGTDIYLYAGIARVLLERGDIDHVFIRDHTEGFQAYQQAVFRLSLDEVSQVCGVDERDIRLAASYIAGARGFLTLWAMGLNQSAIGVKKNEALIALNLLTGHIGKPGSGPFSLTGQPNAMGGREVGGLATMLAAHRSLGNAEHRKFVADYWGVENLSERPGYTATQMLEALERGDLKALWIVCTNPMVSWPDARRAEAALRNARFVVVQDISRNADTLAFADMVLPAAGHFEKEGTMTNSERRISHLARVHEPPGEALPDAEIICRFARAMGFHGFDFPTVESIYHEHAQLTQGTNIDVSGVSYTRLKQGTLQWPVPDDMHKGTSRLFEDHAFYTPSRKAIFYPPDAPQNTSEPVTPEYPLILTTGRIRDQWHTMTKTGKVSKLRQHISKPFLEIHPVDAAERDIQNGDIVVIQNRRGTVQVSAKVTDSIKPGVVFLPMHWGRSLTNDSARANNLTSLIVDPISKEPDFKFAAVSVVKYVKEPEKIVVVGAGAAAYRFICTYRGLDTTDAITVISRERYPFYNRVLLPEYVNATLPWERLQKMAQGELESLRVNLEVENEVVSIHRAEKYVVDMHGQRHAYDKLILATGCRANIPKDAPVHLGNVFTMRTREDADRLKDKLKPTFIEATASSADITATRVGKHVLIIGGGLLGLELAASLRVIDVQVSLVHLGSRLMERQLDNLAGELLLDFIEENNIAVYLNDQVQQVTEDIETGKMLVAFQSGKVLPIDVMVYAVGTRPNIEFIQEAGIESGRGIVVNDYMQTSDESVFAIGEIAEHRGKTLGITSAAEKQADVLARYIHGDLQSTYDGAVPLNILKLHGIEVCSIGMPEIPPNSTAYEEILFIDRSHGYYKKCIIHNDRLVGAVLVGDKAEFAEFKNLIENKIELSEQRLKLLRSGKTGEPMLGKLVCSCNGVGEGNLQRLIDGGCHVLQDVCQQTGAGLGCGSCKPEIQQLIRKHLENIPA